jgi:hypothetical protein
LTTKKAGFFDIVCNFSDTSSSATSQYHAQLYSGQKQLQKRHLQEQKQKANGDQEPKHIKPTLINYKVLSFDAPNLYQTSLKLTSEIDIHAWWEALVNIFSGKIIIANNNNSKETIINIFGIR